MYTADILRSARLSASLPRTALHSGLFIEMKPSLQSGGRAFFDTPLSLVVAVFYVRLLLFSAGYSLWPIALERNAFFVRLDFANVLQSK